jgi:L-arabinonolactonase
MQSPFKVPFFDSGRIGYQPNVVSDNCVLGEAPVWEPASSTLSWVDCDRKQLFRLHPGSDDRRSFDLLGNPGSYAFCSRDKVLVAYRTGLAVVDLPSGAHRPIETPMIDFAKARFNDGACDRAGRFWVGTMHKGMSEPVGGLYRVDPDLSVRQLADGFTVSNGIAFSPDDAVMYQIDSRLSVVVAYDFDLKNGAISNRRVFAEFSRASGRPDGCTIDSAGRLWVALLGAGRIVVLSPAGEHLHSLAVPTSRVTSLCFGGRALDTLYVTSMRLGLSEAELEAQPHAGCVFAFAAAGQGLPEPYFAGG